jgi:hypothetical protein
LEVSKKEFAEFEKEVIRGIKTALKGVSSLKDIQSNRAMLSESMEQLLSKWEADKEWSTYVNSVGLDLVKGPEMFETMDFEGANDALVQVVKEGSLQRKQHGLIKSYKEFYYVVTAAGFLHGRLDIFDYAKICLHTFFFCF